MKRRVFLVQGSLLTTGLTLLKSIPALAGSVANRLEDTAAPGSALYRIFKDPDTIYRPFVRWWWNGDKVKKEELARELRLMKEAGIGGVEINPVKFPSKTDDMGTPAIEWLSPEWIDLLQFTLKEAESLGLTCDLIVGSGWPFGAEWLQGDERSEIVTIGTHKLEGPLYYEASLFDLFKEADPAPTSPFAGRTLEMLSVKLAPDPLTSMSQVKDLSDQIGSGIIKINIPAGKHVLYALVKTNGSMEVINGAPGANGPVLNHYNEAAVKKYLDRMSDSIQRQIGPLAGRIRSFFTDSMELEGANWCADMEVEFKKRRGYDLMPYLPFTQFKTGGMGNIYDFNYGTALGPELNDTIERVRYDFDLTRSELIRERFIHLFTEWCRENKVLSRIQAYGRGYFPLEGSFDVDLPECETWIKYGLGKEMSETDYHIGRAYTMINKYVSSAAHLKGKRHISCEELTNTDMVFNATLEILKVAGDQSAISGVTHPVFHGFNYSPPEAPFPGWIRYGTYINEHNNWWPYFRRFTDYKARLSAVLQQGDMFADIAVLPPVSDMWSIYGAQNEPFPSLMYPDYVTFIWESIHQNGNACDYVSEQVIRDADMRDGKLHYGPRKYHTLFLVQVERMEPETAQKLFDFVVSGGRIFCIETVPVKSVGLNDYQRRDQEVRDWVDKMKGLKDANGVAADRFILLKKPANNFMQWYRDIQQKYGLTPYVSIDAPNQFVTQVRYQSADTELLLFINSNMQDGHTLHLSFAREMVAGRQAWIWDIETGERFRIETGERKSAAAGERKGADNITLDLGPADSRLIVFDKERKGSVWVPAPEKGGHSLSVTGKWSVEFRHIDGSVKTAEMDTLKDLKDMPEFVYFSGTATYRTSLDVDDPSLLRYLNLGKVFGVSELVVNGQSAGTQWYGRRIFALAGKLQKGRNTVEVKVVTVMGNYMKSLKDNAIAQTWTNEKRKDQPIQSMGLIGPVTAY